jgi:nucleoside-diphosphate-sugar epimerase
MSSPRDVLITGAAGFVGRSLAQALAARGVRVTGIDRVALPPAPPFSRFHACDLLDDAALAAFASGRAFDAVVHLAGVLPNNTQRGEMFAINVGGTSAVLEHLARAGCHVVLFSTGLVYGTQTAPFPERLDCRPRDVYAQSKLAAEALVQAWGHADDSPVTVLRPSVLYGTGAPSGMLLVSLLASLRQRAAFAMTAGEQQRDFLHVEDAAAAVAAVLEQRATGTFNLASGESCSVRAAAELAASIAGAPELLRIGALAYRPSEVFDYRLDSSALQRAIGWKPQVALRAGLERMWREMS